MVSASEQSSLTAENQPCHVVVIGGGVIGLACSHYLRRFGHRVTLVDKSRIGGGCSHGACGFISPSHALPLAEPGTIRHTLSQIWRPNSPLRIKPRFDWALLKWMWNFGRRCNESDMMESAHAIHPLMIHSRKLYLELVDPEISEAPMPCSWEKRGLLFVYRNRDAFQRYEPTNDLLSKVFDEPAQKIPGEELCQFESALRQDLAGAWYFEHDAHLRPDQLIQAWRQKLIEDQVTLLENHTLQNFVSDTGGVTSVVLEGPKGPSTIASDRVVVATGAWTPMLSKLLGYEIPIQPGKGYSMTFAMPEDPPKTPMIFPEHRVAVTPMGDRLRLGSIMEFAGYDESISDRRLKLLTDGAKAYLRNPPRTTVQERWHGWRPMTYDSTPVIDRCPGFANVYLAAGHNMLGLSMAPATGRMVAEMISGVEHQLDPKPYNAARFL